MSPVQYSQKICVSLALCIFLFSSCCVVPVNSSDCEWEENENGRELVCDDFELSTGAIAGIVIGGILIFIVMPLLICFCCACACFKGMRRGIGKTQNVVVPGPPQPMIYPQQPAVGINTTSNQYPPSNYWPVPTAPPQALPPFYGNNGNGNAPLPYPVMPGHQQGYHGQPPPPPPYPYPTNDMSKSPNQTTIYNADNCK